MAAPGTVWVGGETDFLSVQIIPDLIDFERALAGLPAMKQAA
jgi:hypothetical protein